MEAVWPGVLSSGTLNDDYVQNIEKYSRAAKAGDWTTVFATLDSDHWLTANQWRLSSTSWFTSLHQAAYLGAPPQVVQGLIERGAWRSLKTAQGERPVDIARRKGHHHLVELLDVREPTQTEQHTFDAWGEHLAELIRLRTKDYDPVRFREVPTEVVALESLRSLWFSWPGMYGGFSISVDGDKLVVDSWSRVSYGSGQTHLITQSGCDLVADGTV